MKSDEPSTDISSKWGPLVQLLSRIHGHVDIMAKSAQKRKNLETPRSFKGVGLEKHQMHYA